MSKLIVIIALVTFASLSFAKKDVDLSKFNKELNSNIETVIQNNPHIYESEKSSSRAPASVESIDEDQKDSSKDHLKDSKKGRINDLEVGLPKF